MKSNFPGLSSNDSLATRSSGKEIIMYDEEIKDDEVDLEPYEGEPDFKSSGVLNDEGAQDDDSDPEDDEEAEDDA